MDTTQAIQNILDNIGTVVIGKKNQINLLLSAMLADGHVLIEDYPGAGKTLLAKAFAKTFALDYTRIQFTPDLLPSDITGLTIFNPKENQFEFHKGPAFTNLLLADEINRATPRTQSSLLECMGENQITIDGTTRTLSHPFFVIATENPIETAGTFPLPEAQLDRFTIKLSLGFPAYDEELAILNRFHTKDPLNDLQSVASIEDLLQLKNEVAQIFIHPELVEYIAALSTATRKRKDSAYGISPRGSLALLHCSKALALIKGRNFVIPDDIQELYYPVFEHRLTGVSSFSSTTSPHGILEQILSVTKVPSENWEK